MATVLAFPIAKLPASPNRWSAEDDRHAEIIELSDYRPVPGEHPREWQAFAPFNGNL